MGQALLRDASRDSDPGQLHSWGSVASTASSDWNGIGLPPLPRQRSLTALSGDFHQAVSHVQQMQQALALANSVPLPEQYLLEQQHSLQACLSVPLQGMGSGPLETLVYEAATKHCGSPQSSSMLAEADFPYYQGDSAAWDSVSPAAFAAAAAIARARRSLHSNASMNSSHSGHSAAAVHSSRSERSFVSAGSPVAMDICSSGSARSLSGMDATQRQGSSPCAQHGKVLTAQDLAMLAKLKAILGEREQLGNYEKQLKQKLEEEAGRVLSGSPRAAAAAAQAAALKQHQQHHQASHSSRRSSSWSGGPTRPREGVRSAQHSPLPASAQHRHSNSTAAALLAAAADPAAVVDYMRAHKQQQHQHQACMAALAAAAAAGSSPRASQSGGHQGGAKQQGLSHAAMAKLRQLMALQQQQIQMQQVGAL